LDWKDAINNLKVKTKRVMLIVGKSFLNSKTEEPHSSSTLNTIMEVSNNLFLTPPALQRPLPQCHCTTGRLLANLPAA
jgi:hypothetical protein